jgi:bifunctional DNA-binding transcriptional regulator/antitoxin component of YhaV-PrlF toxin-antitoxin module
MSRRVKVKRRRGYTRVSPKHQVTLPTDALTQAGLAVGDELKVEVRDAGEIVLRREADVLERFAGIFSGMYPPGYLDELRDEWER